MCGPLALQQGSAQLRCAWIRLQRPRSPFNTETASRRFERVNITPGWTCRLVVTVYVLYTALSIKTHRSGSNAAATSTLPSAAASACSQRSRGYPIANSVAKAAAAWGEAAAEGGTVAPGAAGGCASDAAGGTADTGAADALTLAGGGAGAAMPAERPPPRLRGPAPRRGPRSMGAKRPRTASAERAGLDRGAAPGGGVLLLPAPPEAPTLLLLGNGGRPPPALAAGAGATGAGGGASAAPGPSSMGACPRPPAGISCDARKGTSVGVPSAKSRSTLARRSTRG